MIIIFKFDDIINRMNQNYSKLIRLKLRWDYFAKHIEHVKQEFRAESSVFVSATFDP